MTQTHNKLDAAISAAMIKAREIGVKMLASDCEQILKASGLSDGVSVALKYLRNKVEEYDREYARQDYETGAWEFGSNAQEEYSNSMHELIEEIESLASAPEVGEAVADKVERNYVYEDGEEPGYDKEPAIILALRNTELQKRVEQLEDLLSSAYNIANRDGKDTHWFRFAAQLHVHGISPVTAKTFKILPSDEGYQPDRTAELEDKVKRLVEALRRTCNEIAANDDEGLAEHSETMMYNRELIAEMEAK